SLERQRTGKIGGNDPPVRIAAIVEPDRDVGGKAAGRIDADSSADTDRAAGRKRSGQPVDRRDAAAKADIGGNIVDGETGAGIDEARAGSPHRAGNLWTGSGSPHGDIDSRRAAQRKPLCRQPRTEKAE